VKNSVTSPVLFHDSRVLLFGVSFFIFFSLPVFSQNYPNKDFNPERLVDEIFPLQELDINYQELYEILLQYISHPVDLNRVSAEELRSLHVLREEQVESFFAYRYENGPFLSVYELQSIPGFDLPTLYKLMPFVRVKDLTTIIDKAFIGRVFNESNNYFITRYERTLERQAGYQKDAKAGIRFAGSPDKLYMRFQESKMDDFSFGVTAEKDAGEAVTWKPSRYYYGVDFLSFHGQAQHKGRIRNLIVGDYLAQFGQGLALGGGFGMGLGSETITTIRRSNLGFIPYTSLNESHFLRGMATSLTVKKNMIVHFFGSRFRKDGVVNQDSTDDAYEFVSSLAVTGYHRTAAELASRKQILEINYGGVIQYKKAALDAGVILHETHFSLPIYRNPTPYNQFSFSGRENTNLSVFLNYTKNNFTFFSERAQTLHHGTATIAGLLGSISHQLDISLLYRNYSKDFYSFYSNAVSENTIPQNESGAYWGWKYSFSKKYSMTGYVDLFRFPWLRYRGYSPSEGSEWLMRFNYQPLRATLIFIQAREESKIRNLTTNYNLYQKGNGIKRNYSINCDYSASLKATFKTRMQISTYTLAGKTTRGFALIQDANFAAGRFSFATRYALFSTDDYDNRLYLYERDVWLAFSFPAYYGVGVSTYVLIQFKLSKKIDLWLRWSHTRYTDRDTVGTGGEMVHGNVRNDVKLQVRIRFT